jgi:osmoprotectant transport system permease protein
VRWLTAAVMTAALVVMAANQELVETVLRALFPGESLVVYQRQTLGELLGEHLVITAVASVSALIIGSALGLLLITPWGRRFEDVVVNLADFGQTLPSIAVVALMVPVIGYGWEPVVIALVIYSILPVMLTVVAGVRSVPPDLVDAARGIGMDRLRRFLRVQLPLAMPIILGGVKNMLIINVSAATLGAIVGAGGLGVPILAGIGQFNNALVLEGAVPAVLLALIIDAVLGRGTAKTS